MATSSFNAQRLFGERLRGCEQLESRLAALRCIAIAGAMPAYFVTSCVGSRASRAASRARSRLPPPSPNSLSKAAQNQTKRAIRSESHLNRFSS